MIPVKIEPIPSTPVREKDVKSIAEWFVQHQQSFYILGMAYLPHQRQMEELFYRSIIKVHKEFSRYDAQTSFETWVTFIFIQICRELSNDGNLQDLEESRPQLFKALDRLNREEKEAVVLTYLKGTCRKDAAQLLHVSEEKLKKDLFTGIQLLKKELGYEKSLKGCNEYHRYYIDYLDRVLDRPEKVEFEMHIYHCRNCQEDLASFQDVMLALADFNERIGDCLLPADFMLNVNARLAEAEKHRKLKRKKRLKIGIFIASIFALLMGVEVFTGSFTNLYYAYAEEDPQLKDFLHNNLGEMLNLEAESAGVKITIKSAIADDVQTLIFYEVKDSAEDNQYMIEMNEGVSVKNRLEFKNNETFARYYPPDLESDLNEKEKNVYRGKISLMPLREDKGTVKLKITKLLKLIRAQSGQNNLNPYGNMEFKTGEWNFEIPVTKQPSAEYVLDKETEIKGIQLRFDKLTIAPTTTILQYTINNDNPKRRVEVLNIDKLMVGSKKMKADMYGSTISGADGSWTTFQTHFDPLIGKKPKEFSVKLGSANLTLDDRKTIELNPSQKYPQTFEYAGSTISIDKFEIGQPTKIVISNHEIKTREYESLHLNVENEDGSEAGLMEMDSEGIIVDKNGKEYNPRDMIDYEKLDHPRYFSTVQTMGINTNTGDKMAPIRLVIFGYSTTKYLGDVVKISMD